MDLQIFQIPKMSFQTPSGWESAKARGLALGRPCSRNWGWGPGTRPTVRSGGPSVKKVGWLLGPFFWSQASWLSPSFRMLPLLHSILKHELDHDSFCDSPM